MNFITRAIHRALILTKKEEFFVSLRKRASFFRKFVPVSIRHKFTSFGRLIPESSAYPKNDSYVLDRDDVTFKINRSDYVQWRLFYGVRDNALKVAKTKLRSNSMVLDIGANFGAFSLRLAKYALEKQFSGIHFHAFEPNALIFKNYLGNLELNSSLTKIVTAHLTGLGNEEGQRRFQYSETNTGAGRITSRIEETNLSINITTLDHFVAKVNPPDISFIKMIVEGFEPEVFRGGWNTIETFRPTLFFEVTPEWYAENNGSVDEILQKLRTLGYTFKGEFMNELIPYTEAKFKTLYQYNLLAEPG